MTALAPTAPLRPMTRPRKILSRAEARVLAFGAAGYTKGETADWLGVGEETVKSQRASVIRKLRAKNFAGAVGLGFARGHLTAEHLERVEAYVKHARARRQSLAGQAA